MLLAWWHDVVRNFTETYKQLQDVSRKGMRETVHVLVTTYTEPAATVRECVLRLLVAPEPIYMEKIIYVCDDGYSKAEGPKKREMVEELRLLGAYSLHSLEHFWTLLEMYRHCTQQKSWCLEYTIVQIRELWRILCDHNNVARIPKHRPGIHGGLQRDAVVRNA